MRLSLDEWRRRYVLMSAMAERIREMRQDRARRECELAGLDSTIMGIHPHNAMVSARAGKPWRGIDYDHVRRCLWIQEHTHDPHRLVSAWDRRVRLERLPNS